MQWAVQLLILLSEEAHLTAYQLPTDNILDYLEQKQTIIQRVGHTQEHHW